MDQLAAIRAKAKADFQKAQKAGQTGENCSTEGKEQKGKVIGGKYFSNPPRNMGVKELTAIIDIYQRIKRQKKSQTVDRFVVDVHSVDFFQSFVRRRSFSLQRYGIIYGKIDGKQIQGHCIYEPEQEGSAVSFKPREDKNLEKVDKLAAALGLQRVGVITSAPELKPGGPVLSAQEVLLSAEHQATYGPHCCLIQVRPVQGQDELSVEAYQASAQCVEIWREGTLSHNEKAPQMVHSERKLEAVTEEGKAMVTKQETHDVDCIWFTVPVPIMSFEGDLQNRFIRLNRPGEEPPVWSNVRTFLEDPKRKGRPIAEQFSDFHLLVYLAVSLDLSWRDDWPTICTAIRTKDSEAMQGYALLIRAQAGLDD